MKKLLLIIFFLVMMVSMASAELPLTKTYYWFTKAALETALSETGVTDYSWDGLYLILRKGDTTTPNNPKAGITKVVENSAMYDKDELKVLLFPGVPEYKWEVVQFSFDTDNIYVSFRIE